MVICVTFKESCNIETTANNNVLGSECRNLRCVVQIHIRLSRFHLGHVCMILDISASHLLGESVTVKPVCNDHLYDKIYWL